MNDSIKRAIENGELILFLGAGASKGCHTKSGGDLLDGNALAMELAKRAGLQYSDEGLDEVYAAARGQLESRLDSILEELFRHVRPSSEYEVLGQYAWRRIYTLNIDDGLERAFNNRSTQNVCVRLSSYPIEERDGFFERLDVIKLNGSVDRLHEGIIFSSTEYASATNRSLPWYEQCASDFVRMPFMFVGTKLNEPLLKFHIERYKTINKRTEGKSYVITPSATPIQQATLLEFNIVHIAGTLSSFTNWLQKEFQEGVTPRKLATNSLPQYAGFLEAPDRRVFADLLDGVIHVMPDMVSGHEDEGAIRRFYKGFQPTWGDIIEGVPAELEILAESLNFILESSIPNSITPFIGPAGSGKTTLLMQVCHKLSKINGLKVYFIQEARNDIKRVLEELDKTSINATRVFVAIDNVDIVSDRLAEALKAGHLTKTTILCAERENSWKKRAKNKLDDYITKSISVKEFSEKDAENILHKLKRYGSWTVLGQKKSHDERLNALIKLAKKQLLIALLEATLGRGFEDIIKSDYIALTSNEERLFFLTVGLITVQHFDAPMSLVDRALSSLGMLTRSTVLADDFSGIIISKGDKLTARHPVYVRYLLEHIVDPQLSAIAIKGLLQAFSHYEAPVMKHLNKVEAAIYKGLINHKFLWDILKGRETLIIPLYNGLEKYFELDGLFWLQYGLALRDFNDNDEALEKLRTAYSAYKMDHTQHALGQQLLILGEAAENKISAMMYIDEACSLLSPLDRVIDSDDTYPIVTLAEGHIRVARRFEVDAQARTIAKTYIHLLAERCKDQPNNNRLRECHDRVFKFAATGTWSE